MTSTSVTGRLKPAQVRRLHLVLRDATMIDGHVQIGEDQSLVSYLNSRRGGWINMTRARRPKLEEEPGHLIVQADHIILAMAPDGNVLLNTTASGQEERPVEVVLVGGKTLTGFVSAASQQRLSDFVSASAKFIAVTHATLMPEGRELGDTALHAGAIEIIRDHRGPAIEEGPSVP
jgi:hypothetical protein